MLEALLEKIRSKKALVGVIGLGYVGLPLVREFTRAGVRELGFDVDEGDHAIIPVHFRQHDNDAFLAQGMAADLLSEGIYCIGFSFPVVPRGQARIRLQASAAHTVAQVDRCLEAFVKVGRKHGAI